MFFSKAWGLERGKGECNSGLGTLESTWEAFDECFMEGVASESVPPSSEQAFSQFGHRPSAFGPCSQSARCSVQNIFPQHSVLQGTTAYSKQIPQSRSTVSFFEVFERSRSLFIDDSERNDKRRVGALGTAIPAAAHCSTNAWSLTRLGVPGIGDSAPRSK